MPNSALYDWTKRLDLQCSLFAEQLTMLGDFEPITDDDIKSRMKHGGHPLHLYVVGCMCWRIWFQQWQKLHQLEQYHPWKLEVRASLYTVGTICLAWGLVVQVLQCANIYIKITKEYDIQINMFPDNELGNQLLIKDCTCWLQVSRASKYRLCCSRTVIPVE